MKPQTTLSVFFNQPRPTHPEEKLQSLVAVKAVAEGDEDGCVGGPHSRPGWAGWAKRVLYFYQAPWPDPAHYHQGSEGPRRPGWEGWREGGRWERGRGRGGRRRRIQGERGLISQPLSRHKVPRGEETETATQTQKEREKEEVSRKEWEMMKCVWRVGGGGKKERRPQLSWLVEGGVRGKGGESMDQ